MSEEALRAYVDEIATELRASYTTLLFAKAGLRTLADRMRGATLPDNPDPQVFIGDREPGAPGSNMHAQVRYSQLMAAAEPRSAASHQLEQMWMVTVFHKWESVWRPEIARLMGVAVDRVVCDVFGDLRYFRHDILKHQGIAQSHNTGKNRVLTWVSLGQRISCSEDEFQIFMDSFGVGILSDPDAAT